MWRDLVSQLFDDAEFGEPASESDVERLETAFNLKLPEELKDFLRQSNGVEANYAPLVWSVDEIIEQNQSFRENEDFAELYMPFDCLFFFGGEGGGDQFAYLVLAGQIRDTSWVFKWDHASDNREWFARDVKDFLERSVPKGE